MIDLLDTLFFHRREEADPIGGTDSHSHPEGVSSHDEEHLREGSLSGHESAPPHEDTLAEYMAGDQLEASNRSSDPIGAGHGGHSHSDVSFGSAYPKVYYLEKAEGFKKEAENADSWAESYARDENPGKAASFAALARDYWSRYESAMNEARHADP